MGPTLNTAAAMDAYALADRATWLNFKNARDLRLLVEGDKRLFNQYGSILVNPERPPGVHSAEARLWHEWLTSPLGQQAIADFRIGGKEVFFPDYKRPAS
jgi:tungstate transport system substrate-binding protein